MNNYLPLSRKFDLLVTIFQRRPIRPILDACNSQELVEIHSFLWDKLVEIHYLTQTSDFRREAVTQGMVPSATYQRQQGCDLSLDYCKGVECIWSNPICAGNKVKNNLEVIAKRMTEYFYASNGFKNGQDLDKGVNTKAHPELHLHKSSMMQSNK